MVPIVQKPDASLDNTCSIRYFFTKQPSLAFRLVLMDFGWQKLSKNIFPSLNLHPDFGDFQILDIHCIHLCRTNCHNLTPRYGVPLIFKYYLNELGVFLCPNDLDWIPNLTCPPIRCCKPEPEVAADAGGLALKSTLKVLKLKQKMVLDQSCGTNWVSD